MLFGDGRLGGAGVRYVRWGREMVDFWTKAPHVIFRQVFAVVGNEEATPSGEAKVVSKGKVESGRRWR